MLARYEKRRYAGDTIVWAGKYKNSLNLPHWHNDCELVLVEEGSVSIYMEGMEYTLLKGQSLLIESARTHYMRTEQDTILALLIFDNSLSEEFSKSICLASPVLLLNHDVERIHREITTELKERPPYYATSVNLTVKKLLLDIYRNEQTDLKENHPYEDKRYKELMMRIDTDYAFITFSDAADFMGFSHPYFSKYFQKMSGMPFALYLNSVRIEKAVNFLHTEPDLKITEIAIRCGFDTIRNFNRVFKSITGYTPRTLPESFDTVLPPVQSETAFDPTQNPTTLLSE